MATVQTNPANDEVDEWTKPPFLRRVRIRGFKSIAFCDVELKPLTILVGRNASGKSNFIDALAFLRDAMNRPIAEAAGLHGGAEAIRCRSIDSPRVEIGIEAPCNSQLTPLVYDADYHVRLSIQDRGIIDVEQETLRLSELKSGVSFGFDAKRGKVQWFGQLPPAEGRQLIESRVPLSPHLLSPYYRPDRLLLSVLGDSPTINLALSLENCGFYNFHPETIRKPQQFPYGGLLNRDGSNIANVLEILREKDPETANRIRTYLSTVVEDIEDFAPVHYGPSETVQFWLRSVPGRKTLQFDAGSMSDGTLRALSALVAAFQVVERPSKYPSLVAIEEPETSLHPAAMRALVSALDEATGRTQILLTTHSAELLEDRDLTPSQVLVVRNKNGQTQIAPVDSASQEIIHKELYTLADLHRQDHLEPDAADIQRQTKLTGTNGES